MAFKTTSFVQGLAEASATAKQDLGTIRDEGDKGYKYVQYEAGAGAIAIVAGSVVAYDATAGYASNLVTGDVSDDDGVGAGVAMAALADGEYGWIQIWGLSGILEVDCVSGAVGQALTMSTTTDSTLKVAGADTEAVVAFLYDDTASSQKIICCFPK
jgi:hypothetical protein